MERTPKDATHWSRASLGAETGLSRATVGRIWRAFSLKPHLVDTFKLSTGPLFIERVRDVVGPYLNPPERALVLCVDEKTGVQALDRSSPVLPLMPGMPDRRTHDYARSGVTTLFAALDVASGQIIGSLHRRYQAVEFKKFLATIDASVPPDLDVHLNCDPWPPTRPRRSPPGSPRIPVSPALHANQFLLAQPGIGLPAFGGRRPRGGLRSPTCPWRGRILDPRSTRWIYMWFGVMTVIDLMAVARSSNSATATSRT